MVAAAWGGTQDADAIALVIDAKSGFTNRIRNLVQTIADREEPRIVILNKVDVTPKESLLALATELDRALQPPIFMVSAATGDGIADLKATLAALVPEGPGISPRIRCRTPPTACSPPR